MDGQSHASKKAGWLQAAIYLDSEYDPADNKDLLNIRATSLALSKNRAAINFHWRSNGF